MVIVRDLRFLPKLTNMPRSRRRGARRRNSFPSIDLVRDAGVRVCGDVEDVEVELDLPADPDLDEAVAESAGLDQIGWKRLPGDDVAHARQAEDRIAVMLDQPFAALIVFVHRSELSGRS
jgi:hypothetical protein